MFVILTSEGDGPMRKRHRKSSINVLWLLPPAWLVAFGVAFVRAHVIVGESVNVGVQAGLGAMAFMTIGFVIAEVIRRDSERRSEHLAR